jgi:hypothetical protein
MPGHEDLASVRILQNNVLVKFIAETIAEREDCSDGLSKTCDNRTLIDVLACEAEKNRRDPEAKLGPLLALIRDIFQDATAFYSKTRYRGRKR